MKVICSIIAVIAFGKGIISATDKVMKLRCVYIYIVDCPISLKGTVAYLHLLIPFEGQRGLTFDCGRGNVNETCFLTVA